MTQTTPELGGNGKQIETPEGDLWAVPTGPETEDVTTGPIDWKARIAAIERTVRVTVATPGEERTRRETAERREVKPRWRVDWDAVSETEAWLRTEWAAGRRGWAGPPGAYDILPCAVPEEVMQIGGVLLARCAGYAAAPDPRDVAAAVEADTPTRQQWRALQSYLLEATGTDVRTACQAGEIDLRRLMEHVQEIIERDGMYGLRSVEEWLTR